MILDEGVSPNLECMKNIRSKAMFLNFRFILITKY